MNDQEMAVADEIVEEVAESPPTTEAVEPVATAETSENVSKADSSYDIHALEVGQRLQGTVKNIAEFGAFVDVGIPQDGLVHISKLARHKVEKVSDVVSEGQEVEVWVKKVDTQRGRLSLTMIKPVVRKLKSIEEGIELQGTVTRLESYGAFVDIESERDGLVHISQITHDYIKHPKEVLKVGDSVAVKVISVNRKKRQVDLSIKALLPEPVKEDVVIKEEKSKPERSRPTRQKVAKQKEEFVVEENDGEPMMTAMAAAYAALQGNDGPSNTEATVASAKNKRSKNEEMDAIIARTLANREK